MKNKLLSLLLVITLLAVTVSVALPTTLAANDGNLFENGDFASYSGYTPSNWTVTTNQSNAEIVEDVELPNGNKVNALKVIHNGTGTKATRLINTKTIKIEKNASYTMTFWVKVKDSKGLTVSMFEPNYVDANGNPNQSTTAKEGQNIYSFRSGDRPIRQDVVSKWTIAETGTVMATGNSMVITRVGQTDYKDLTPDFPEQNRKGEWVQVVHTFETGDKAAHEAEISYEFKSYSWKVGGEVWLADFEMYVEKEEVDAFYTPTVNNVELGAVSKEVPLISGKVAEITAEPFGENGFDGWYVGEDLVSKNKTITFTYDPATPPVYEARFTKAAFGFENGSFESYTNDKLLSQVAYVTSGTWTDGMFKDSSKDGENLYFADSTYNGEYRKFQVTNEYAHTGSYSAKFTVPFGFFGRKITGLSKNSKYTVSFYAMSKNSTKDTAGVNNIIVTDANTSAIYKNGSSLVNRTVATGALAAGKPTANAKDAWTKYEITFETGDNTEVILWADSNGDNSVLYVDNYSITRPPFEFTPSVNNPDLGFVTPNGTICKDGDEVTVVANSTNDGKFVGWYIGDDLKSDNKEYTFIFAEEFKGLEARFEAGKNSIANPGLESYENGKLLAQLIHTIDIGKADTTWTDQLFLETSKDGENIYFMESNNGGTYRIATVTNAYAHSGKNSIQFEGLYGFIGRKFTGLEKNTEYVISYYGMVDAKDPNAKFGNAIVAKTNSSIYNTDGSQKSSEEFIARNSLRVGAVNTWTKDSIRFNSGDNTEIILWINHHATGKIYLDDFSIGYAPKLFKPASNNSSLGKVTPDADVECSEGDKITVTATPYPDADFNGWYVGDELISTEATFTFEYADKYQGLTAVFAGIPGTIPNGGFEYYQNGQVLASYNNNNNPKYNNNPPWSVDTSYKGDTDLSFTVTNTRSHSGDHSARASIPYRVTGLEINDLEPNTEYMVSFWAYITGKDPDPNNSNHDQNPKEVTNAFVLPLDKSPYQFDSSKNKYVNIGANHYLGAVDAAVNCYNSWKKIDVVFKTPEDSGDVRLWINFSGYSANLYLDDFSIGFGVKASAAADLGGSITTSFASKYVLLGSEVTVEATPFEGNTFAGWYNAVGERVSTNAVYTFNANEEFSLVAKFDGYNKPAVDLFAMNGMDGTFENGTVPGWSFNDKTYECSWCGAKVDTKFVYEGTKALAVNGRYRNSVMTINNLTPNSDYRLSFYVNLPDHDPKAAVANGFGIIAADSVSLEDATIIYSQAKAIQANTGWYKIDMYFNPGSENTVKFAFRFTAETLSSGLDKLYIDNLSLFSYSAFPEATNGSFDDGKTYWIGDGKAETEGENNVLALESDSFVYQPIKVDPFSNYTVTFKAKGKLTAGALDLGRYSVEPKSLISSVSYVDVDGTEWNEYTYSVYSGINEAINFAFTSGDAAAYIDDFTVVKEQDSADAILEKIDFETDRFDLTKVDDSFSLYIATEENDPFVKSGRRSLKFNYNEGLVDMAKVLEEGFLSYQTGLGNNFKVTFNYLVVGGKAGGVINLAPDFSGTFGADIGFEHMSSSSNNWESVSFYINNTTFGALKLKIASAIGATAADFYVDDIVISVTPPMVSEENSKITYCERLYNAVDNEGFESPASAADWKNLSANMKIVKGDALKGSHFLRVTKGKKYVVQFKVEPNTEYTFAASIRGTKNTVGSIGVTTDKAGKAYYFNRDGEPASKVVFDPKETTWKRRGFKFLTDGSGEANICIDVTSGTLDIDSVMLFTNDFGYRYDPNDYTVYVPYDYDNLKSETSVLNGGFGKQPYYTGKIDTDEDGKIDGDLDGDGIADDIVLDENDIEEDSNEENSNNDNDGAEDDSPATGDSRTAPAMIILLAVVAVAVLMLSIKRKEGAENA